MASLVAVMIMVSIATFDWSSIAKVKSLPISTSLVTFATMMVTIFTNNLALSVLTGVLLASLFFANKISHFMYHEEHYEDDGKNQIL